MFRVIVKVLIIRDGKVLLIKRDTSSSFGGDKWDIPGGKLEFGELPEETLHREISEETSLNVKLHRLLDINSGINNDKKRQYITIVYVGEYESGEVILNDESSEYTWIDIDKATNFDNIYYVEDALKKICNVE